MNHLFSIATNENVIIKILFAALKGCNKICGVLKVVVLLNFQSIFFTTHLYFIKFKS